MLSILSSELFLDEEDDDEEDEDDDEEAEESRFFSSLFVILKKKKLLFQCNNIQLEFWFCQTSSLRLNCLGERFFSKIIYIYII